MLLVNVAATFLSSKFKERKTLSVQTKEENLYDTTYSMYVYKSGFIKVFQSNLGFCK